MQATQDFLSSWEGKLKNRRNNEYTIGCNTIGCNTIGYYFSDSITGFILSLLLMMTLSFCWFAHDSHWEPRPVALLLCCPILVLSVVTLAFLHTVFVVHHSLCIKASNEFNKVYLFSLWTSLSSNQARWQHWKHCGMLKAHECTAKLHTHVHQIYYNSMTIDATYTALTNSRKKIGKPTRRLFEKCVSNSTIG